MTPREKKKKAKERRLASLRARSHAGFDRVLEAMGIAKKVRRLPKTG